jgi:hypothetical protein
MARKKKEPEASTDADEGDDKKVKRRRLDPAQVKVLEELYQKGKY